MLDKIVTLLEQSNNIYIMGNGGSAAIANHAACDWLKATRFTKNFISLSSNPSVITMIANDYGYEYVFEKQLRATGGGGTVVLISSSGKSENIIRAAEWAKETWCPIITMTGFDGGQLMSYSEYNLHAKSDDYGIIEDVHQSFMHDISRKLKR